LANIQKVAPRRGAPTIASPLSVLRSTLWTRIGCPQFQRLACKVHLNMQAIVNEHWRKTQIIKFAESCGQVSPSIAKWRLLFFWMTNFAKKVSTGGRLVHLPKMLLFMV